MQKADCTFGRKAGSCCSSRQIKKNVDRPLCFATTMTYAFNLSRYFRVPPTFSRQMRSCEIRFNGRRNYIRVSTLPKLPSKPLTLDLFFRRTSYHGNASYRKVKIIKVVEKFYYFRFTDLVLFIFGTWLIQRSYGTCKKRSKVSMRSKVRSSYGTFPLKNLSRIR
jgi:hypothetical protein